MIGKWFARLSIFVIKRKTCDVSSNVCFSSCGKPVDVKCGKSCKFKLYSIFVKSIFAVDVRTFLKLFEKKKLIRKHS